ncbi:hypothetical protein L1887_32332 [Cichorium endivia]|nr:hypothetical protein L1887_32332 [Cichorium endivia]
MSSHRTLHRHRPTGSFSFEFSESLNSYYDVKVGCHNTLKIERGELSALEALNEFLFRFKEPSCTPGKL